MKILKIIVGIIAALITVCAILSVTGIYLGPIFEFMDYCISALKGI